ncbi:MAG TPA: hypothetical protein PKH02_05195 [Bacteroidales bacterium]|nr:hypothetical protein [Bacteroidales bacterium]
MDINNAVKIILRDIEEARSILDEVGSSTHITEIDLVNARLHSAAEIIALLPRMTGKAEPSPAVEKTKAEKPAEVITIKEKPAEAITIKEKPTEAEAKKEKPARTEKQAPPAEAVTPQQNTETLVIEAEPVISVAEKHQEAVNPSQQIFADKFDKDNVLGEQLSAKPDNDLLKTLSAKPVEDITTAIGINDRFFFTRELFGGKQEEYYRAISRLNKAPGLDEAMDILDSSVVGNPDVLAYTAFTDLLKRKFPVK